MMGYISLFYIESKVFELLVLEGVSFLRLVERRHGLSCVMLLGKFSIPWLKN
jgi:hypothetical protein